MNLILNYMVSRVAPGNRRRVETRNGKLNLDGGVWLDQPTRDRIFREIHEKNPGWDVGGFAYVSGPHDGEGDDGTCGECGYLDCPGDCGVVSDDDFPAWD